MTDAFLYVVMSNDGEHIRFWTRDKSRAERFTTENPGAPAAIPLYLHSPEAESDKARLDWLSDRDNTIGNVQLPTMCVMRNLHSLRAAIDDAMTLDPVLWDELGGNADGGEHFPRNDDE